MSNNIGYHTRLYTNNSVKCVGGSFGGSIDMETVNRLVNNHFTVKILPSGAAVFVDKESRPVSLYISVDPYKTEKGKAAKAEYSKTREALIAAEEEEEREIEELLSSMSTEEILKRLR